MKSPSRLFTLLAIAASAVVTGCGSDPESAASASPNPVLTVEPVAPKVSEWPVDVDGEGRITAWQYSIIGSQVGGVLLEEVLVEVGDRVTKGQVIARLDEDMIAADLLQATSDLESAKASLEFADRQFESGRRLSGTGALSKEAALQYKVNKESAEASVRSAQARVDLHKLRLSWADVKATDDGVISSRSAIQGDVVSAGAELFRLIRGGRLEWQGKFTEDELYRVEPGQAVNIQVSNGASVEGRVRKVSPVIEPGSLMGTIYVDLPKSERLRAGMYAAGSVQIGSRAALNVPDSAIVHRDGYEYVAKIDEENRARFVKIDSHRRNDGRVEIQGEIAADEYIVASGADFLMEGDLVELSSSRNALSSRTGEGS